MNDDEFTIVLRYNPTGGRADRWSASSPTSDAASVIVGGPTPAAALRKLLRLAGLRSVEARFGREQAKARE